MKLNLPEAVVEFVAFDVFRWLVGPEAMGVAGTGESRSYSFQKSYVISIFLKRIFNTKLTSGRVLLALFVLSPVFPELLPPVEPVSRVLDVLSLPQSPDSLSLLNSIGNEPVLCYHPFQKHSLYHYSWTYLRLCSQFLIALTCFQLHPAWTALIEVFHRLFPEMK